MKILGFVDKVGCVLIVESMRRDLRSLGGFVWKKRSRIRRCSARTMDVDGCWLDFSSKKSCIAFGPSWFPPKGEGFFLKAWFFLQYLFQQMLAFEPLEQIICKYQKAHLHKQYNGISHGIVTPSEQLMDELGLNIPFLLVPVTPFADVSLWYFVSTDIKDCGACDAQVEGFLLLPYPKCLTSSQELPVASLFFAQLLLRSKKKT